MTKFQEEKRELFRGQSFSESRKQNVLATVNPKHRKKFNFMPTFALAGIAAILFLLWIDPFPKSEVKHAFTENSLEKAYYEMFAPDGFPGEVMYVELKKFESNDAILITKNGDDDDLFYVLYYGKFENNKWQLQDSIGFREYEPYQHNPYQILRVMGDTINTVNNGSMMISSNRGDAMLYVGAFSKENMPQRVLVGKEEVELYDIKGLPHFWVEKVNSAGTPVYFVEKNSRKRVIEFDVFERLALDVMEPAATDIVISGSTDMHGAYDTFADYDLLVDPSAYAYGKPSNGDVVYLKNGQLARILVTDQNGMLPLDVKITEGTVLINDYFLSSPYMVAHFDGINSLYDNSQDRTYLVSEGEYFAKADNWANSDAFEGIITLDDIVGKVKGYSLMSIEVNWPVEVLKGYSDFSQNYDPNMLKGLNGKQIALIQKYAEYNEDYRTVYELYSKNSLKKSYEEWLVGVYKNPPQSYKQRLLYEADLLLRASEFDAEAGTLKHYHPITNETKYAMKIESEDDVWKVKFDTIINLNY